MTDAVRLCCALLLVCLGACSPGPTDSPGIGDATAPATDVAKGHAMHSNPTASEGQGLGTVLGLSRDGRSVLLDHGPIDGIGMGAMTMQFDVAQDVATTELRVGADVAFIVRQTPEGGFEIMQLCAVADGQDDCLEAEQGH